MKYRFTLPMRIVTGKPIPKPVYEWEARETWEERRLRGALTDDDLRRYREWRASEQKIVHRDVTFEAEVPGESDLGDGGEASRAFVDRAVACARYVVKALERKPVGPEADA